MVRIVVGVSWRGQWCQSGQGIRRREVETRPAPHRSGGSRGDKGCPL